MCVAAFGWGIFSLLGRRSTEPLGNMAASFVWCVPLGALAWLVRPDALDIGGAILAIVAGTLTSGLGYALWYRVLPQLASSHAAVAQLTVPLIASVGGLIFLSEPLTVRLLIASALVLGGVFISLRAK